MKRKLLLILALTLVVVTVVAGLAGCKAASAKSISKYFKDGDEYALITADASSLVGYEIIETLGDASYLVKKAGVFSIAYVDDAGALSLKEIANESLINGAPVVDSTNQVWQFAFKVDGGADIIKIYSAKGELVAEDIQANLLIESNRDFTYVINADTGVIIGLNLETLEIGTLKDAKGKDINYYDQGIVIEALEGGQIGDYYIIGGAYGIMYCDSNLTVVANVIYPEVFDGTPHFQTVLANGNMVLQGVVELPDDAKKYDYYEGYTKYDVVTVMYNVAKGNWVELKGYDDVRLTEASMPYVGELEEDVNLVRYYAINNAKIDDTITYVATMSNKGKLGEAWFADEDMEINSISYSDGYLVIELEDVIGSGYYKVFKGNKLIQTISASDLVSYVGTYANYYINKKGEIRCFTDTDFVYDAKGAGYEYIGDGLFDYIGGENAADPAGTYYYVFNETTKAMAELFQDADGVVNMDTTSGAYYIASYADGDVYYALDGTVILEKGYYTQTGRLFVTLDSYGAVSFAKAIFWA